MKNLLLPVLIMVTLIAGGGLYQITAPPKPQATAKPAAKKTAPRTPPADPYSVMHHMSLLAAPAAATNRVTLLAWNDLGMHCISPRFAEMAILPPFNNVMAVVIERNGEDPAMVTDGYTVTYSLDNNTSIRKKTDFWAYAYQLYGRKLPKGVGLTGNGLSGTMAVNSGAQRFEATGIPALPYNDARVWDPFQHATIQVRGGQAQANDIAHIVVPVSDELNCAKCHATGQVAAKNISTPTVEGNILTLHDLREKTNLMGSRPVSCAGCHADPALNARGAKGVKNMSLAMHGKHAAVASPPACYDCHPGPKTQCNRSAASDMGPHGTDPRCDHCHGTIKDMATGLAAGRKPWLQEPTCAQCHGATYDTAGVLYRQARGHGGVYCIACHNSPHAWWPSTRADDNALPWALQRNTHAIGYNGCFVCHSDGRTGTMPPHNGEGD